ncbi:Glycerophosphoryl diester phosphodiesterase [Paraburkholderia caribensis MBA4]|uniref:Glycerophosphoryl diester phosphodiesterase n=1 Tax=Paraburkholderia caribensis MBA4 TaxID=1323664 RepID=A0A0P0RI59_9BURK|nr:hypothetical protein [Paraburkholderia caribensis]ALL68339.1 Glycerophosphoryl diester phosphodiesterase [Paraburkholderia caribensis MBA4]
MQFNYQYLNSSLINIGVQKEFTFLPVYPNRTHAFLQTTKHSLKHDTKSIFHQITLRLQSASMAVPFKKTCHKLYGEAHVQSTTLSPISHALVSAGRASLVTLVLVTVSASLQAQDNDHDRDEHFRPGLLVVSRSVYDNLSSNVQTGTVLPPNCASTQGGCNTDTGAIADGTYPFVWNNDAYDGSFGITSRIFLDQITPGGAYVSTLEVPNSLQKGFAHDQLVTSFSSKSELALHLSTDGKYLTFMGYVAPINTIDVSNSNTPGVVDPTNPVGQNFYRAVARVDRNGHFRFTETNAYSGNNGRSAILNSSNGNDFFYTAGNAGNGGSTQPNGVVLGAGAQFIDASKQHEARQTPSMPTPLASFSVTELGAKADKIGKDDNFRGMTVYNNVLYFTKGSGGNGVNTVYFVDTTGTACPNGVGVPSSKATLPTAPLTYNAATLQTNGLPSNMCILAGFPSVPNKTASTLSYPFGLWFADANTLYVADEGDGYTGGTDLYTHAAAQPTAGLQKWVYNSATKSWSLAYTLQNGLDLGTQYAVTGYPMGSNAVTKLPWAPAADGLRNLTGRVDDDGTATIWAITSTVSGNGDVGADPNKLVAIRDVVKNTKASGAALEKFVTLRSAGFAEVLRGVSFTPGTHFNHQF